MIHMKSVWKYLSYIKYVTILEMKIKVFTSEIWKRIDPIQGQYHSPWGNTLIITPIQSLLQV